jgi:hypothetical protein
VPSCMASGAYNTTIAALGVCVHCVVTAPRPVGTITINRLFGFLMLIPLCQYHCIPPRFPYGSATTTIPIPSHPPFSGPACPSRGGPPAPRFRRCRSPCPGPARRGAWVWWWWFCWGWGGFRRRRGFRVVRGGVVMWGVGGGALDWVVGSGLLSALGCLAVGRCWRRGPRATTTSPTHPHMYTRVPYERASRHPLSHAPTHPHAYIHTDTQSRTSVQSSPIPRTNTPTPTIPHTSVLPSSSPISHAPGGPHEAVGVIHLPLYHRVHRRDHPAHRQPRDLVPAL